MLADKLRKQTDIFLESENSSEVNIYENSGNFGSSELKSKNGSFSEPQYLSEAVATENGAVAFSPLEYMDDIKFPAIELSQITDDDTYRLWDRNVINAREGPQDMSGERI